MKEGWWQPSTARKWHYFVEGRSLCGGWAFPDYRHLNADTGESTPGSDDCKDCHRKLVKRRTQSLATKANDNE